MNKTSVTHNISWGWANRQEAGAEPWKSPGIERKTQKRKDKRQGKGRWSWNPLLLVPCTMLYTAQCRGVQRWVNLWGGKIFSLYKIYSHHRTAYCTLVKRNSSLRTYFEAFKRHRLILPTSFIAQRLYAKPGNWDKENSCLHHALGQIVESGPQLREKPKKETGSIFLFKWKEQIILTLFKCKYW